MSDLSRVFLFRLPPHARSMHAREAVVRHARWRWIGTSTAHCCLLGTDLVRVAFGTSAVEHISFAAAASKPANAFVVLRYARRESLGRYAKHQRGHARAQLSPEMSDEAARRAVVCAIDDFVHERFVMASRVLAGEACRALRDGDAVLTYGHSATVLAILLRAHAVRPTRTWAESRKEG